MEQLKYKVGDNVRIITSLYHDYPELVGSTGKIIRFTTGPVSEAWPYVVSTIKGDLAIAESEIMFTLQCPEYLRGISS